MNFGTPDAVLYPPPAEQLTASASCRWCAWTGTAYVWPAVAAVGRHETPLGHLRAVCPECGGALGLNHPSRG